MLRCVLQLVHSQVTQLILVLRCLCQLVHSQVNLRRRLLMLLLALVLVVLDCFKCARREGSIAASSQARKRKMSLARKALAMRPHTGIPRGEFCTFRQFVRLVLRFSNLGLQVLVLVRRLDLLSLASNVLQLCLVPFSNLVQVRILTNLLQVASFSQLESSIQLQAFSNKSHLRSFNNRQQQSSSVP